MCTKKPLLVLVVESRGFFGSANNATCLDNAFVCIQSLHLRIPPRVLHFHCPRFSQHVLGQTIHWQLPKERWPTVGTVNGRIGGTKMSSRRRKNLLRRGCDTAPFSRRRDWRCTAYERALSNCYIPKLLTACCVHSSVALLAG